MFNGGPVCGSVIGPQTHQIVMEDDIHDPSQTAKNGAENQASCYPSVRFEQNPQPPPWPRTQHNQQHFHQWVANLPRLTGVIKGRKMVK